MSSKSTESFEERAELVFLRQFLRAAFNDSFAGDEAALVLAQRIDDSQISETDIVKRSRAFLRKALSTWRAHQASGETPIPFSPDVSLKLLRLDDELEHHIGILTDVLELTVNEAAECLGIERDELIKLREKERERRSVQLNGSVLIIEDDPFIASDVADIAESTGLRVSDICTTVDTSVAAASHNPPSLVISDYDLGAGGSGADAVKEILSSYDCPAIFVTGYPDRVLSGRDFEPTFVLEKPYKPDVLRAALYYASTLPSLTSIDGEGE